MTTGLGLVLLGAGLAAVPSQLATAAEQTAPLAGESLVQRLKGEAQGAVRLATEPATGKVGFARAARNGDLLPTVQATSARGAAAKAAAYLDRYAVAFGAPAGQLQEAGVAADPLGWTVTYTQRYEGLPVFGAQLKATVDKDGDLTAVTGYVAPDLRLGTTPRIGKADAARRAVATVKVDQTGDGRADLRGLRAVANDLTVYRTGAIRGVAGETVLAYVVEVANGTRSIRDKVFVDATTGKLLNRYSLVHGNHGGPHQELFEAFTDDNGTPDDESDDSVGGLKDPIWKTGDTFPGELDADQQSLVEGTGEAYWFFKNTFGRDSYDGKGAVMKTVNNDPRISCPNANWNGQTTNYCTDVTSDDTVAHEWGHAYTEYTSGLIYQWQPGAMNEAFSDIWGETVDIINDRGNQTPAPKRADGLCSAFSGAIPVLTITAPEAIAKECVTGGTLGELDEPVTGQVVAPTDAVEDGGTATDGCSTYNDVAAAAGKIVLVDRGLCTFVEKAQNAKSAGAIGVIIGNREDAPVSFSDADRTLPPTVSIGLTDREAIRKELATGETVEVEIVDAGGERFESYRWLSGEGDAAFGGAIRDMWNPTCYGDPGKVTDAEYKCSTDDSGGVHSNSGVVNHTYALLVDGGTSNDVEVPGIGLDKAAAVFWRTQTTKLGPTSDFADLADGLAASCTELVGQPISKVSVATDGTPEAAEPVTTTDCAAVDAAAQATELATPPAQCNFKPLLAKGAPGTCGKGTSSKVIWGDDFSKGLKKWKKSERVVFKGGSGINWRATSTAPGRKGNKVAYDPSGDVGQCTEGEGDKSSANAITSPAVKLRAGLKRRLQFRHYMATEAGYDGGNVKIKVNGAKWKVVPAKAYVFNKPNTSLATEAEENTNPLAGEQAFSGTDGGVVNGSWGTSVVDLGKAGAKKGDKIKIRFELGRDGCGGIDGWYVDDVKVVVCKQKKKGGQARREVADVR
ncbi:M4 family metallopeptidase [Nocardioides abyssi]|uniref:M4 family metallopeptidase n=1 Tax=Nocardioides abyssi TaxID=3058370 RepID=A0ABT8EUQ6_9ACTN|nr:M4 family metallopeptidase [Nocardioides abyssi]MDN4161696.1 M4 family metallopeptidase [Nocardioides abyssi]